MPFEITVNSSKEEVADGTTMLRMLEKKNVPVRGAVVEVNGKFVDSANYSSTVLHEGDKVDVINMIGGG